MTLKLLSRVQPFVTLWTVAYQAPPSMEFSRQEYIILVKLLQKDKINRRCIYAERVCRKEMAHVIMEASKSKISMWADSLETQER